MIRLASGAGSEQAAATFIVAVRGGLEHLSVAVVGDFNGWNPDAHPLTRHGSTFQATVCLPVGRRYAFKYIADGRYWFNDHTARDHQVNAYGGIDSILDLTDPHQHGAAAAPPAAAVPAQAPRPGTSAAPAPPRRRQPRGCLSVTSYIEGNWAVVHVGGEIDPTSAPQLREALLELVAAGHGRLVVDLDAVEFMDSTGPAVLLAAREHLRAHGGVLRVVCTCDRVGKVFRLTGLTDPRRAPQHPRRHHRTAHRAPAADQDDSTPAAMI